MNKAKKKVKQIALDTAGIIMIILAGLTGWLPGPGGIPLLIAGLALLSINHEWAKHWLDTVKKHGFKLSDKLFNNSPTTTLLIDIFGVIVLAGGVFIVLSVTQNVAKTAAIWLIIVSIALLLGNRGRIKKLKR